MDCGFVKVVIEQRGFGFIAVEGGADTFFHRYDLQGLEFDQQLVGRRVACNVVETAKGPRAYSVRAAT